MVVLKQKNKWGHVSRKLITKKVGVNKARNDPDGIRIQPITQNNYRTVITYLTYFKHQ